MNKTELVKAVADKAGVSQAEAAKVVAAGIDVITCALKAGDKVQLVGFGTFGVSKRAAREGRNPKTGAVVKIAACKVPAFKAGAAVKDAIN